MTTEDQERLKRFKRFLLLKILQRKLHSRTLDRVMNCTSRFVLSEFEDQKVQSVIHGDGLEKLESIQGFVSYHMVNDYFEYFDFLLGKNQLTVDGVKNILFTEITFKEALKAHKKILQKNTEEPVIISV